MIVCYQHLSSMIAQGKILKDLKTIMKHKIPWMRNLFGNLLRKDTKRASQYKILLGIHLHLFLKEVRAKKVFIKFCLKNTDSRKGSFKHNKKKEDVIAKNLNVSNYIANVSKANIIAIRIVNAMTVVIETKTLRNTRRQLFMYLQETLGDLRTKK
mgnify:FL=1